MPLVSIVIPCYNHGIYINDALNSALSQTFNDYEIIIVNDGSTDPYTNDMLKKIDSPKTQVITTKNQGLVSARNTGIAAAKGELILPLDSDDKIYPTYLEKAVRVFQEDPSIGIVYCKARLFGAKKGAWDLPEFTLEELLHRNIFYVGSFFYKKDWHKVNGYNPNMVYGWEDWDFWLSLIELGIKPYKINEILFCYRVRKNSMAQNMTKEIQIKMRSQIFRNHQQLYANNIETIFERMITLERTLFRRIREDNFKLIANFFKNKFSQHP